MRKFVGLSALLAGCSAAPPPPSTPTPVTPPPAEAPRAQSVPESGEPTQPAEPAQSLYVTIKAVDDQAAHQILNQLLSPLRQCYEEELGRDGSTEAEWACFLRRDATGAVTSVEIPGAPHPQLRQCIAKVVRGASFGAPTKVDSPTTFFVFMTQSPSPEEAAP